MKHIWAIISALAAVASVVVAWYIYLDQTKKSLDVEEQYKFELLRTDKELPDELQITYEQERINNFVILGLRVHNSGSVPIEPRDYAEPVSITLKGVKRIISVKVKNADPPGLDVGGEIIDSSIELEKELLNPTDTYIVEIGAVPEKEEEIKIDRIKGRISGIKEIGYRSRQSEIDDECPHPWWLWLMYLIVSIQVILVTIYVMQKIPFLQKRLPFCLGGTKRHRMQEIP